ncbi:MAG: hypothetical protein AB7S38_39075 [Vulcanimicrobiota bacterium]
MLAKVSLLLLLAFPARAQELRLELDGVDIVFALKVICHQAGLTLNRGIDMPEEQVTIHADGLSVDQAIGLCLEQVKTSYFYEVRKGNLAIATAAEFPRLPDELGIDVLHEGPSQRPSHFYPSSWLDDLQRGLGGDPKAIADALYKLHWIHYESFWSFPTHDPSRFEVAPSGTGWIARYRPDASTCVELVNNGLEESIRAKGKSPIALSRRLRLPRHVERFVGRASYEASESLGPELGDGTYVIVRPFNWSDQTDLPGPGVLVKIAAESSPQEVSRLDFSRVNGLVRSIDIGVPGDLAVEDGRVQVIDWDPWRGSR